MEKVNLLIEMGYPVFLILHDLLKLHASHLVPKAGYLTLPAALSGLILKANVSPVNQQLFEFLKSVELHAKRHLEGRYRSCENRESFRSSGNFTLG